MRSPLVSHVYPSPGGCCRGLRPIGGHPPRGSEVSLVWGCRSHGDPAGCYSACCCQHDDWPPLRDRSAMRCRGARREVPRPVPGPRTRWAWPSAPWWSPSGPGWSLSVGPGSPGGGGWWLWLPRWPPTSQQEVHFDVPVRRGPPPLRPALLLRGSRQGLHPQGSGCKQSVGGLRSRTQSQKWRTQCEGGVTVKKKQREPNDGTKSPSWSPFTGRTGRLRGLKMCEVVFTSWQMRREELTSRGRVTQTSIHRESAHLWGTNTNTLPSVSHDGTAFTPGSVESLEGRRSTINQYSDLARRLAGLHQRLQRLVSAWLVTLRGIDMCQSNQGPSRRGLEWLWDHWDATSWSHQRMISSNL